MSATSDNQKQSALPGQGVFGWLGRQVGYVRRAVNHQVPDSNAAKIYRSAKVEEQTLPHLPNVKLRRTTIDELVIDGQNKSDTPDVTDRPPTTAK